MTENKPETNAGQQSDEAGVEGAGAEAAGTGAAAPETLNGTDGAAADRTIPGGTAMDGAPQGEAASAGAATVDEEILAEASEASEVGKAGDSSGLENGVEQELAEIQDKYLRLHAEFDNYKRRMHKEQGESLKYAQLPLLRDLTGVMDNLERAIDHARNSENQDHKAFVEGLEMVTKQIGDVFERYGMERIEAKGQLFDPTRHEAMNIVETETVPENTVVEEFQVGYVLHERIVRPTMVSVSKKPGSSSP